MPRSVHHLGQLDRAHPHVLCVRDPPALAQRQPQAAGADVGHEERAFPELRQVADAAQRFPKDDAFLLAVFHHDDVAAGLDAQLVDDIGLVGGLSQRGGGGGADEIGGNFVFPGQLVISPKHLHPPGQRVEADAPVGERLGLIERGFHHSNFSIPPPRACAISMLMALEPISTAAAMCPLPFAKKDLLLPSF
jgi:hypothetical protein